MKYNNTIIIHDKPWSFAPKSISEAIKNNYYKIRQTMDFMPGADLNKIIEEHLGEYVSGDFPTNDEIMELSRFERGEVNEKSHLYSLCQSYYLTKQAEKYLSDNKVEFAWSALSEARYHCAGIDIYNTHLEENVNGLHARNLPSKGGKGRRDKLIIPTQKEVIRLLKEKCPPEKWGSEKLAAKAIAQDSVDFMRKNGISLSRNIDTHTNTIIKWIKNIPEVQAAFQECCSTQSKGK